MVGIFDGDFEMNWGIGVQCVVEHKPLHIERISLYEYGIKGGIGYIRNLECDRNGAGY